MGRHERDSYHHGDLRSAAISAAAEIIDEQGVDAVSMRKVAQRVGVTHSAFYQHFADKRVLLSAVSEKGYRRLASRMRAARKRVGGEPLEEIRSLAVAYVFFAADEPAHFRVMSEPGLTCLADEYPPMWEAHDAVVTMIVEAVGSAQRSGVLPAGDPREIAMTVWTFTHGYAETGRTRRGFFHDLADPPRGKTAVKRHFLSVFEPLIVGLRDSR